MKNIFFLFTIVFTISFNSSAQFNDYKYIVIPKQFETFNKQNQYQTSTLLKYLFSNSGYTAVYDDAFPKDLLDNGCLALKAYLDNNPSLFLTKVNIVLKDCNGQVVFTSVEGRTKEKEYKTAYNLAIREAFKSFENLNYKYSPKEEVVAEKPIVVSFKNDVKSLDEETAKTTPVINVQEAVVVKNIEKQSKESVEETQTVSPTIKEKIQEKDILKDKVEVLYAQPTEDGFQLVDSTPKIQYNLIETSVENVFLANHGDKNGVVLNKNGKWFFEYKEGGEKKLKELNIKF
jgi:hypothetical protein